MKSNKDISKLFKDHKSLEVQPSAKAWRKLERKLGQHRRRGRRGIQRLMAMAAALLALIVFVLLLTMVADNGQSSPLAAKETTALQLEELKLSTTNMDLNAYRVVSFTHSYQDRAAPIFEGSVDSKLVLMSGEGRQRNIAAIPTERPIARLSDFNWLLGHWQGAVNGKKSLEYWQQLNDQNLRGQGMIVHKRDTLYRETILLEDNGEELVLWVQLAERDRSYPFVLAGYENGQAIFINPNTNNFPEKILLVRKGEDSFALTYFGKNQTDISMEQIDFLKRRNNLSDRQIQRELSR